MCRPGLVLREEDRCPHCFPLFYPRQGLMDSDQTSINLILDRLDHFLLDGVVKM